MSMGEEEIKGGAKQGLRAHLCSPVHWIGMLAKEMHWSFVYGVVAVNGVSQGMGGAVCRVSSDYYWKDVQKVMPSEAQVYQGITSLPWIVKPLWGLLTDVLPIAGYQRRPYFILAGLLGAISMLALSLQQELCAMLALVLLTAGSAGVAIADVTIDACVAHNSLNHPSLAADMQSLCGMSASIGGLLGFSISGVLMHAIGSQGTISFIFSVGSVGSLLGVLLHQKFLKGSPFRPLLFWAQLLSVLVGMLDLALVLRLNLKIGVSDRLFVMIDESISQMIGRIRWMPLLVLSSKLCPSGIEGTFFALLMSIDHAGMLTSSGGGDLLLQLLKVTRTKFGYLWAAILIRAAVGTVVHGAGERSTFGDSSGRSTY